MRVACLVAMDSCASATLLSMCVLQTKVSVGFAALEKRGGLVRTGGGKEYQNNSSCWKVIF